MQMKRKKKTVRKKNVSTRGRSTVFLVLFVAVLVGIAALMSGVFYKPPIKPYTRVSSGYTCCDTGDGDLCKPRLEKQITYNGDTYALLKSNFKFFELGNHLDPTSLFSQYGERIYLNTTDRLTVDNYPFDHPPYCIRGQGKDWIYSVDPADPTHDTCIGIPNDMLIYTCRADNAPGECDKNEGIAFFDSYYRVKDGDVPTAIKNCKKPTGTDLTPGAPGGKQKIINAPNPSSKPNLQLETFQVQEEPPSVGWVSPYCKPAIYLYPPEKTHVSVKISPNGRLSHTDPTYPQQGWDVTAYPDGKIDYANKSYNYLYYEAEIPDEFITLPQAGFIVPYRDISTFLTGLLPKLGLNQKETGQFTQYWEKALPESPYYIVKIVSPTNISVVSPLSINPVPQTVIRVTLHFEAVDNPVQISEPQIQPVQRSGFTVVEWGGIFKKDKNHPFSCLM